MTRKFKNIDKANFEKLCGLMCTEKEICDFFNVTDKTLTNWCKRNYKMGFKETFKHFSAPGKTSIRRAQYKLGVEKLNPSMLIWLGKQYLGQKDNPDDENIDNNINIVFTNFSDLEAETNEDKSE